MPALTACTTKSRGGFTLPPILGWRCQVIIRRTNKRWATVSGEPVFPLYEAEQALNALVSCFLEEDRRRRTVAHLRQLAQEAGMFGITTKRGRPCKTRVVRESDIVRLPQELCLAIYPAELIDLIISRRDNKI